jgi:hypothetical protein
MYVPYFADKDKRPMYAYEETTYLATMLNQTLCILNIYLGNCSTKSKGWYNLGKRL